MNRALFIDFDLYAGDDPDFKGELIDLMIDNLRELEQAYRYTVERQDQDFFRKTCHKVKTTLSMLADQEFDTVVEELKSSGPDTGRFSILNRLAAQIIASLRSERLSIGKS